jgi:nucleoside 2-deoxyribosyltransferase
MKIYIAAHCPDLARSFEARLPDGFVATSQWHDGRPFKRTYEHTEAECYQIAIADLINIRRADAVVLISGPDKYSGGSVEAGIAYGMGKPVCVHGRRENMLTWLFQPWPWGNEVKHGPPPQL